MGMGTVRLVELLVDPSAGFQSAYESHLRRSWCGSHLPESRTVQTLLHVMLEASQRAAGFWG
jgi:hypothetical protein